MFASKDLFFTKPSSGYTISRSVRLRSSASAYLNRTPTVASNRTTWTWNAWIKRGGIGATDYTLFSAGTSATDTTDINFSANSGGDVLLIRNRVASTNLFILQTTPVYRDPAAWYMVTAAFDTTQATAADRFKLYVNGVQVTVFSTATYGAQNSNTYVNATNAHRIGASAATAAFFDGYLTEINFVDGQALTPTSFGETDAVTGVWKPKKYTGTYGTNGFYLNFSDNSSNTATTIGKDYSGNGNNWTPNNISVTTGVTYDSMLDVPTLYADGGNGRGNYAVLNPLGITASSTTGTANGNLQYASTGNSTGQQTRLGSIGLTSGKWYFEWIQSAGTSDAMGGFANSSFNLYSGNPDGNSNCWGFQFNNGTPNVTKKNGATATQIFASSANNDVMMIAVDLDALKIWIGKNGTWSESGVPSTGTNAQFTNLTSGSTWYAFVRGGGGAGATTTVNVNFGQQPFSYTPPTGFVALNTQNLSTPTISNGATVMAATTYTGTGATQSISNAVNGVSFQPDFVWFKSRATTYAHALMDSVRGVTKALESDSTAAEQTSTAGNDLSAFTSTGFTVGAPQNWNSPNNSGSNPVAWQWNAGGSTVTNTTGSISAQVRANATAGFSVVTYTGTGANATVGHGLGVAPSMIIVKSRSTAATNWTCYHVSNGATKAQLLNTTQAAITSSTYWNNTAPTSTVMSIGTDGSVNTNASTFVAYCFSAVAGYSAFGSYTGNGAADGPFIYCGFRPRFVMVKCSSAVENWYILDTSRDTYNPENDYLLANTSTAEASFSSLFDFLSNGFKVRGTAAGNNTNAATYIYMAFAENPLKYALAR